MPVRNGRPGSKFVFGGENCMNERLGDVLKGRTDNYLLPFYWLHGDHHDTIPEEVERI